MLLVVVKMALRCPGVLMLVVSVWMLASCSVMLTCTMSSRKLSLELKVILIVLLWFPIIGFDIGAKVDGLVMSLSVKVLVFVELRLLLVSFAMMRYVYVPGDVDDVVLKIAENLPFPLAVPRSWETTTFVELLTLIITLSMIMLSDAATLRL